MKMKKKLVASAGALFLSVSLAAGAQVVVRIGPPPAPPAEVIPVLPRPGWVWRPGFYRWNGFRYIWVPGGYVAPPFLRARWIPGHWRPTPAGYIWIPGHWIR